MDVWGVRLVGLNAENITKLLLTLGVILLVLLLRSALAGLAAVVFGGRKNETARFWPYQVTNLASAALMILAIVSIWFDDPTDD